MTFDQISVISDLHIGGKPGRQIFREGDLLGAFIDKLRKEAPSNSALVINGDMVDFLAEEDPKYFDPEQAIEKLNLIFDAKKRPEFARVWEALKEYTQTPHRRLAITLGNHDLELALPWVRDHLLDKLSGGDSQARERITLAFDGAGFACKVGGDDVLCLHGNEVDTWNVTDYEALRRVGVDHVQKRKYPPWTPNAGAKLVIDVMNEIKQNHAFVDVLKPEKEAVLKIVYALKPALKSKLLSIAAIATRRIWDEAKRRLHLLSGDEQLDGGPDSESYPRMAGRAGQATIDVDTLMERVEEQFRNHVDPLDLIHERGFERLGWWSELVTNAFRGKPHEIAWSGVKELSGDATFQIYRVDVDYDRIDALVPPEFKYVVTGHTHLARILARRNGDGTYYNTGTWAALMRLKKSDLESAVKFEPVFERLKKAKTIQELEPDFVFTRPTVATIWSNSNGKTESSLKKVTLTGAEIELVDIGDEQ